jgi:release factor glutamine methyltransferase
VIADDSVVDRLSAAGCVAAEEEAAELAAAAPTPAVLEDWLRRREDGQPLAWIIGSLQFSGHRLQIDPGVYVPRFQTEDLARRAAALLPARGRAADLCTGVGAIAVHLMAEVPAAHVVATDVDVAAARCARRNGVRVVVGDLDAPIGADHTFDLVTAVAPYVPTGDIRFLPRDVQRYEPRRALDGGPDGLALVRRVVAGAARLLRPGGWLLMELGGRQDQLLSEIFAAHGFDHLDPWRDEEADLRSLAARAGAAR